jgi:phosphate transport system permease protein
MAVILVAGNSPQFISSPLDGVRTLTATIALEMGYAAGRHSNMLFAIGMVLLIMIFILNGILFFVRRRAVEDV